VRGAGSLECGSLRADAHRVRDIEGGLVTVTCRRCLADQAFDIDAVLDAEGVPDCGSCAKPMVRGERGPGTVSAANYVLEPDVRIMRSLRRVPGLVRAVQLYAKVVTDDDLLLMRYADDIEISAQQLPEIYDLYVEAGSRLGLSPESLPPLFVEQQRAPNASTAGVERAHLVVTSGLLELMTDGELVAVLGHELGHVQAGHFTYTTALHRVHDLASIVTTMTPVSIDELMLRVLGNPAVLAWVRAAERTADRAGLLAARRPRDMVTGLMKLAGAPPKLTGNVELEAFTAQATRFEELIEGSVRRRLLVAKDAIYLSHPFPAVRVSEALQLLGAPVWFDILERVHEAEPGKWERVCDHCQGLVAAWDVVCRHCAWTVEPPEQDDEHDESEPIGAEPPPETGAWREMVTEQAKRASSWRPSLRSRRGSEGGDDAHEPGEAAASSP
jgi:Zn-dependent protease with chaperone function